MGRKSKEEGTYVYVWLIHFEVQQKLPQHYKATTLQIKKKKKTSLQTCTNAINHLIAEDKWMYFLRETNAYFLYYMSDDSKEKLPTFKFHFYHLLTMQSRVSNPSVPY